MNKRIQFTARELELISAMCIIAEVSGCIGVDGDYAGWKESDHEVIVRLGTKISELLDRKLNAQQQA